MATRIRLQRHGRKARPFYHIVVADSRAKRDGRFIEKLGTYNPMTNPASISLNFDSAVDWLMKGAEPSDTAKRILSYKGVLLKKHLLEGKRKGALTDEQVEAKFAEWLNQKETKLSKNIDSIAKSKSDAKDSAIVKDKEVNSKRAEAISAKNTPPAKEKATNSEEKEVAVEENPTEESNVSAIDKAAEEGNNEKK